MRILCVGSPPLSQEPTMHCRLSCCLALIFLAASSNAEEPKGLAELRAVYATAPYGYPADKAFARPDVSVPFRWHHFHDGAIERFDDARMSIHTAVYNPLEGEGEGVR